MVPDKQSQCLSLVMGTITGKRSIAGVQTGSLKQAKRARVTLVGALGVERTSPPPGVSEPGDKVLGLRVLAIPCRGMRVRRSYT